MSKAPVIILAGPTGVGKTALSLKLAQVLNAEIISADSMQVYRGMDIGTAKASEAERALVPHHLLDVADSAEPFGVADYVPLAEEAIRGIIARGRLPLIVGGTGFYIQALLKGLDFSDGAQNPSIREARRREAEELGPEQLHARLRAVDPDAADAIHPNNIKRVIRALEYYEETGRPISQLNREQAGQENRYDALYLVLTLPREKLYRRIDERVEQMFRDGLPEEVRRLKAQGVPRSSTAAQGLGYKELWDAADADDPAGLSASEEQIKLGSRHYAKRQLTWFRREKDAVWIDRSLYPDEEALFEKVLALCRDHLQKNGPDGGKSQKTAEKAKKTLDKLPALQ